jgi:hypothetical protein
MKIRQLYRSKFVVLLKKSFFNIKYKRMKSLFEKFIETHSVNGTKSFLIILFFGSISGTTFSQAYNPETGNTHYPNGTIYVESSDITNGPIVSGPKLANGDWERVDCTKNEKRCAELLKEATPDKDGKTPGTGDNNGEATAQSLGSEMASEAYEYRTKQLKIKYGVWTKQHGKWQHIKNPGEWTAAIISSWKKKK